jgi:hypothetical protein
MCDANEDALSCVLAWAKTEGFFAQRKNLTPAFQKNREAARP